MSCNLKSFESYRDEYFVNNNIQFNLGDRVLIVYKRNKNDYLRKGNIFDISMGVNKGDCSIQLDDGRNVIYYYTNIKKIIPVVVLETGEAFDLYMDDFREISTEGLIGYSRGKNMYYCNKNDQWRIENCSI